LYNVITMIHRITRLCNLFYILEVVAVEDINIDTCGLLTEVVSVQGVGQISPVLSVKKIRIKS